MDNNYCSVGSHYAAQDWDEKKWKSCSEYVCNVEGQIRSDWTRVEVSGKNRAEFIAEFVRGYLHACSNCCDYNEYCVNLNELESFACRTLQGIPTVDLKEFIEWKGISVEEATRPSLIVGITEYVYADVLEPAEEQ